MVFGLKDFILGTICFALICILSCFMGQKKIVLKYIVFYVAIVIIQEVCAYTPQAIETILSIFTLFIRVMIPVILFASTFIATTKVSELIAAMYSLRFPRSITITFAMVLRFFPTFSEEIHRIMCLPGHCCCLKQWWFRLSCVQLRLRMNCLLLQLQEELIIRINELLLFSLK